MKWSLVLLFTISLQAVATTDSARYFSRPLNCPLRFSQLNSLRDQMQVLVSSLGSGCTQSNQQAINQLTSGASNLEGIITSFDTYNQTDGDAKDTTQYAKNVGQILNGINIIASNSSCFYDIRSRGALPVVSDIIMSISQFGLLVPNTTGQGVAVGGYIVGASIKIIHELVKKKFNFDKPEERRAFVQLNCAFFDSRRIMEEVGIFNPETEEYREEILEELKKEKVELVTRRSQSEENKDALTTALNELIESIPSAKSRGLSPILLSDLEEVQKNAGTKPIEIAEKLRQVQFLSEKTEALIAGTKALKLDKKIESSRKLFLNILEKISPDLAYGGKAWSMTIDEYEFNIRGPLFAFLVPVTDALKNDLAKAEAELAISDPELSKNITKARIAVKENETQDWSTSLRLASIDSKIQSFMKPHSNIPFSSSDEGTSNEVEILDYYRRLQNSLLGKEGMEYLKNALKKGKDMREALDRQVNLLDIATTNAEKCSAAEKIRFAWGQYRYKVEEAHDFVATNLDLYRSNFRVGNERIKRRTTYVLEQIDSVETYNHGGVPDKDTVGDLMKDVKSRITNIEMRLKMSECF